MVAKRVYDIYEGYLVGSRTPLHTQYTCTGVIDALLIVTFEDSVDKKIKKEKKNPLNYSEKSIDQLDSLPAACLSKVPHPCVGAD